MNLNNQQQRVYDYLLAHPGSTAREITNATFIDARARMSEMRNHHGIVFKVVGHKKLGNGNPFKMYEIDVPKPAPKPVEVSEQAKQLALSMTA
jgi:hypothetical protein